jgi:hypothetical protein
MNLSVHAEYEPAFGLGDHVWVIAGKAPQDVRVLAVLFQLGRMNSEGRDVLLCTGYLLDTMNLDGPDDSFPPHEVYASELAAQELAAWHPVDDISELEWKQAIGDREDDDSLDECELSRCCTTISRTRDILAKCQENSGLIERDLRILKELFKNHEYPSPNGLRPQNLDKIIGELGFLDQVQVV